MFWRYSTPRPLPRQLGRLRHLPQDRQGGVAIMFALMLVALCLFVGAAVDIGRWLQARHQTIAAMDAAVLAGGRVMQDATNTVAKARAAALLYYQENTKGRAEVVDDTISFDAIDNNSAFVAKGNAYLKTTFLSFANIPKLPLLNTATSEYSRAEIAGGGGGGGTGGSSTQDKVEVALMLDVTGSMGGNKIVDLRAAATNLVNNLISDATPDRVRIALIPFSEGVRLPSSANSKARGNPPSTISVGSGWSAVTYQRTDCVVERTGTQKYTDAAPGTGTYVTTLYKTNSMWGGSSTCDLSSDEELFPLSKDRTTLVNRIKKLNVGGSTAGHIGTAWAWYTLSPNWNSLWSTSAAAAAYGKKVQKIAILMTDGEYNLQYAANGVDASTSSAANGASATQAKSLCSAMKTAGITIYTVGFALGGNQTAIQTLSSCASDAEHAYVAETGTELQQVYKEIALKISPLYLSH
jgi:Flp pilus assembly protein TadG